MTRPLLIALMMAAAVPAGAQDAAVAAARAAGGVGEGADGYLAVRNAAGEAARARVDQINIKRRAAYTDLAGKRGVSVSEVAGAAACQILDSVAPGEWYRDAGGSWRQRTGGAAVAKPDYCG